MAGVDFERVWRAYGRYGNKQSSRQAFDAIENPDIDHIVERAAAWAVSAKPGQRRMPMEKWLATEKYDEADRSVKPRKPPVEPLQEASEDGDVGRKRESVDAAQAAEAARAIRRAAIDIRVQPNVPLSVIDAHLEPQGGDTWLVIETDGGEVAVLIEGGTGRSGEQEEGQAHLGRLADACGIAINELTDLRGKRFMVVGDTFSPPPRVAA